MPQASTSQSGAPASIAAPRQSLVLPRDADPAHERVFSAQPRPPAPPPQIKASPRSASPWAHDPARAASASPRSICPARAGDPRHAWGASYAPRHPPPHGPYHRVGDGPAPAQWMSPRRAGPAAEMQARSRSPDPAAFSAAAAAGQPGGLVGIGMTLVRDPVVRCAEGI
jgi:hypothetical protein